MGRLKNRLQNPLAIAPRPRPHAGDWPMYLTGRTQYPLSSAPMQTAMSPNMWAGSELGQWTPLKGYGANYPAAPQLSQMQQAEYLVTQPMQNENGYQMVAVRDNGVPLGGTPATTPHYVTAGPIQPTALGFVQPIMREEQTPLAGDPRRPSFNPTGGPLQRHMAQRGVLRRNPLTPSGFMESPIDPDSGPFQWNNRQGATVGPMGGGPEAWPFVTPPPGYIMAGTDAGGWPVFALAPDAPPDLPIQVPKELQRAATNPALPAALSGIPLMATALGAGAVAGGVTAFRGRSPKEKELTIRRARVRSGVEFRGMKPARVTKTSGGSIQGVKIMQASAIQPNPVVWPWVLGGFAALGAGAYGAFRCSPGQRLFSTDSMPGASVSRTLDFEGCFQEHPWRAKKITQVSAPGVQPIEENRSFANKRDAMAWLYTGEDATALPSVGETAVPEDNPRPAKLGRTRGHGMARRFRSGRPSAPGVQPAPGTDDCTPPNLQGEKVKSMAKAEQFYSLHHRYPNSEEMNALINQVYASVYPYAPYPIPSATHPCAKRWLVIRAAIGGRLKHLASVSRTQGGAKWWMRGAAMQPTQNPIPGSVGYNGYFHGNQSIPGSTSYRGYTHGYEQNPSPENAAGRMMGRFSAVNQAAQQRQLAGAAQAVNALRLGNPSPENGMARMMAVDSRVNLAAQQRQMMGVASTIQAARLGNPSPENAAGRMMGAFSAVNQAAQQRQLAGAAQAIDALRLGNPCPIPNPACTPQTCTGGKIWDAKKCKCVRKKITLPPDTGDPLGHTPGSRPGRRRARMPVGARPQWSGFRSPRRMTAARMVNPGEPCCSSCAIGAPCAGACKGAGHGHGHGKGHGACCDSCAVGGPCEGCGVSGGCNCK